MAKKLLKRLLPDPAKIKQNKTLSFLGAALHEPGLWHLNRHSVARAVAIGFFSANLPLPAQMIIAAILAIRFNATLPIAVVLVWITNPLTIPFIFFFNYLVGSFILQEPAMTAEFQFTYEWVSAQINHLWWPLLTGSIVMGIISAGLGYLAMSGFWHWRVKRDWHRRLERRAAKANV
jgi:uncharacterized protein